MRGHRRARSALVVAVVLITLLAACGRIVYSTVPATGWSTNGPVYAVKIVGDRVFVGGDFTQVRSPGATSSGARVNLFAIDRTTGALVPSFVANSDGATSSAVRSLASDGTSLFVGGHFTAINGVARANLAAVDIATGSVRPFDANVDAAATINGLVVRGSRLHVGGAFAKVAGAARTNIALVNKDSGALDGTFHPNADGIVAALATSPDGNTVYAGGDFVHISGATHAFLAALDATSGVARPINFTVLQHSVLSVDVAPDGKQVFAGVGGEPDGAEMNLAAAFDATTGNRVWKVKASGDVQAVRVAGGMLYMGFHDGFDFQPGTTDQSVKLLAVDPATGALDASFRPVIQDFWGVRSIDATDQTLAIGGEFTHVSGRAVQGVALLAAKP